MSQPGRLLACLALLLTSPALAQPHPDSGQPASVEAPSDRAALAEQVAAFLALEQAEYGIPGVVVAIVEDGQTVLLEGYGLARLDAALPMTPDTILRAGSTSKLMTSLAVVGWLEAEGISLDAPVEQYLGTLDLPRVSASPATFRDYLTHSAGFDDSIEDLHTYRYADWQPLRETLESRGAGPVALPGRAVAYSSWPLAILGAVMEEQTGATFDAILDASVFGPLGMRASTFVADRENYGVDRPQALGYRIVEGAPEAVYPFNHVRLPPGIALRTTGRDMSRFLEAVLARDNALPASVWSHFQAPQLAHYPGARGRALGPSERFDHGHRALWHDGNGLGFVNRTYWIPEAGFGFYIGFNHALMEPGPQVSDAALLVNRFTDFILEARLPTGDASAANANYPRYLVDDNQCGALRADDMDGYYRPANFPRRTLGRIASLFDGLELRLSGHGLQAGSTRYQSVDGTCRWRSETGRDIAWQPGQDAEPPVLYLGAGAFVRAPWFESPKTQAVFAAGLAIGSLILSLAWLGQSGWSRRLRGLLAGSAALPLAGLIVTLGLLLHMDPQDLFLGRLGVLNGVVPGLLLSALAGGVVLVRPGCARRLSWSRGLALCQAGVAVSGVWMAHTWNLPWTV